ncbi:unnamed protein product [Soboliphyme baturini]|uniref:Arf-GAP domain-containing protein n=1 Tax=Soboliphyme baturini TaxID=241478 RepID=A0A183IFW1_9BILA|nr:unnamed protein product [Soboliphyme baturini]
MASPRTRAVLSKARKRDDNNNCFECGAPNTQWITVHYGTWLCLECAGKHRGLGVHLSFVRSVTMDKWKDIEIEKVKVSGNRQCLEFLSSQPDYRADWSFSEKWNSRAAAFYRDKVNSLALGKPWSPETSPARNWIPGISGFIKNSQSFAAANSSLEEDFGRTSSFKRMTTSFSGFGSVPPKKEHQKPEFLESAISSLSVGWSALSRTAAHAASFAKDSVRIFLSRTLPQVNIIFCLLLKYLKTDSGCTVTVQFGAATSRDRAPRRCQSITLKIDAFSCNATSSPLLLRFNEEFCSGTITLVIFNFRC